MLVSFPPREDSSVGICFASGVSQFPRTQLVAAENTRHTIVFVEFKYLYPSHLSFPPCNTQEKENGGQTGPCLRSGRNKLCYFSRRSRKNSNEIKTARGAKSICSRVQEQQEAASSLWPDAGQVMKSVV